MMLQNLPFDLIVERLNDGVLIVGLDGQVVYANSLMLEILGRTWEEVEGRTLFDFMSPEWAERARENLKRRARGVEERFDHQFLHSSGEPIWAMVSTRLLEFDGSQISLVAIRDITARRNAESELRALKEELEGRVLERTRELEHEAQVRREAERLALEESATKTRLLANMSHELRTPLHTIIGYTELLLEEGEEMTRDERERDLERVLSSGRHLLTIIGDILNISKIEAGEEKTRPTAFGVVELIDEIGEVLAPSLRENGNVLVVDDGLDDDVVCLDRPRLKQIMLNLVSNATRHTRNGDVTVRLFELESGRIRLDVEDVGRGIAPESMLNLFEPFVRIGEDTHESSTGTGLGLAISKRYCEMMGGKIKAISELGRGSTFMVELPRVVSKDETP